MVVERFPLIIDIGKDKNIGNHGYIDNSILRNISDISKIYRMIF